MNEKDSKAIHDLFYEFHYSDNLGLLKSKLVDYATTIREEARRAAFKDAIEIAKRHWVLVPAESENRPLDVQRWQGYNLAAKEIRAALEAAERGERDG